MNLLPSQSCFSTPYFNVTQISRISMSAWWQPRYLLPFCAFGSAIFWSHVWTSQPVIKHQSTDWCEVWSNECQRKRWQRSARWSFESFFFLLFFKWELGTTTGRQEADFRALCPSSRIRDFFQHADAHSWSKLEDPQARDQRNDLNYLGVSINTGPRVWFHGWY